MPSAKNLKTFWPTLTYKREIIKMIFQSKLRYQNMPIIQVFIHSTFASFQIAKTSRAHKRGWWFLLSMWNLDENNLYWNLDNYNVRPYPLGAIKKHTTSIIESSLASHKLSSGLQHSSMKYFKQHLKKLLVNAIIKNFHWYEVFPIC